MKMNYLNKNNNIALSKRTKSGDKDKFQTIKNSKFQYNQKYMSYFNSPKKGENVLFMKKKFQKIKKNSGEKIKSEIINNINNSNNNISGRGFAIQSSSTTDQIPGSFSYFFLYSSSRRIWVSMFAMPFTRRLRAAW